MFDFINRPARPLNHPSRTLAVDVVAKFDRLFARVSSKLAAAMEDDHTHSTPEFMKNRRADELAVLLKAAKDVRSISDLCVVDELVERFEIDGR